MQSHFELSDALFEEQFKNGTLDPALFNHKTGYLEPDLLPFI